MGTELHYSLIQFVHGNIRDRNLCLSTSFAFPPSFTCAIGGGEQPPLTSSLVFFAPLFVPCSISPPRLCFSRIPYINILHSSHSTSHSLHNGISPHHPTLDNHPPPLKSTDFPSPLFKRPAAPAVYPLSDDAADVPPSLLISESLTDEAPFPLR